MNSHNLDLLARDSTDTIEGRRYLIDECGHWVKLVWPARDPTFKLRNNDLRQEAQVLERCNNIVGVPRLLYYHERGDYAAIVTEHIDSRVLVDLELSAPQIVSVLRQVLITVAWLSVRGISHNDIKPENVLIGPDGKVWLIDFDQATTGHRPMVALIRNLVGSHFMRSDTIVHGSMRTLARTLVRKRQRAAQRRLPKTSKAATPRQRALLAAWRQAQISDANAPGDGLAYYELDVEGLRLPGERDWAERWAVLEAITSFEGKRVLELGCNMGLLSVFLKKDAGAAEVWGIDHDARIVATAEMVASAFETDAKFSVVDLVTDPAGVEELIAYNCDVVTCLNVWNWLPDTTLLVSLLETCPEIIYEGHDSVETETARLQSFGFSDVRLVTTTERGRPVLHGRRTGV